MPDNEKFVNKVIYNGTTLIDLTGDTVTAATLASGITAHDMSGAEITGTCSYDVDSTDATAAVAEILATKTAYARGAKLTGTMPNNGGISETISTKDEEITIPQGYHDGSGKVGLDPAEKAKLIPGNILRGVELFGITGNCEPSSDVTAQTKSVTPSASSQTILPDQDYDYLSQVTVAAIPYVETENAAGGKTVTIAG